MIGFEDLSGYQNLCRLFAKLADHADRDLLTFFYLEGAADVAVGSCERFVVDFDL